MIVSSPPMSAITYGITGVPYIITALEADRVVLRCPDGLKRVPLDAIIRWELLTLPKAVEVGDRDVSEGFTWQPEITAEDEDDETTASIG
jgi:hypothetical protein